MFKSRNKIVDSEEKAAMLTLEIGIRAIYTVFMASFFEDEMNFDAYNNFHKTSVDLCETFLTAFATPHTHTLCFDTNVVLTNLACIGCKCREPRIRRKILSLLVDYPRREGTWDSVIAGKLVELFMGIEEEFIEGDCDGAARSSLEISHDIGFTSGR